MQRQLAAATQQLRQEIAEAESRVVRSVQASLQEDLRLKMDDVRRQLGMADRAEDASQVGGKESSLVVCDDLKAAIQRFEASISAGDALQSAIQELENAASAARSEMKDLRKEIDGLRAEVHRALPAAFDANQAPGEVLPVVTRLEALVQARTDIFVEPPRKDLEEETTQAESTHDGLDAAPSPYMALAEKVDGLSEQLLHLTREVWNQHASLQTELDARIGEAVRSLLSSAAVAAAPTGSLRAGEPSLQASEAEREQHVAHPSA